MIASSDDEMLNQKIEVGKLDFALIDVYEENDAAAVQVFVKCSKLQKLK